MSREGTKDIFQLLLESAEKKKEEKVRLLESLGVREYFEEGSIGIDKKTCEGIECKLCIEACPTNALYWGYGEVKIAEELCVYCAACVLCCIVDDCIHITRRRPNGEMEEFSTPTEASQLLNKINTEKRVDITKRRFPKLEEYIESLISIL
jgi:Fe-S-cluster-containing hydrogenase component 2